MTALDFTPLPSLEDYNGWADYWRYKIGVNVIAADSRTKRLLVSWAHFQDSPITEEQHNQWKSENAFSKGMAIVLGKVWHRPEKKGYYLVEKLGIELVDVLREEQIRFRMMNH